MSLDELSAKDLAEIDSVCLAFEKRWRDGKPLKVDTTLQWYRKNRPNRVTPQLMDGLREELLAVEQELSEEQGRKSAAAKKATVPFQSRPVASRAEDGPVAFSQPAPVEAEPETLDVEAASIAENANSMPSSSNAAGRSSLASGSESSSSIKDADRSAAFHFRSGATVGPYQIGEILAQGGMGVVYQATDTRLDRPVAVKVLGFPHLDETDPKRIELVERFEREARAIAALSHPNIVELFDVGVQNGTPYAVMEFLQGATLSKQLRSGRLSAEHTRVVGLQIASALATAHAAGVIHRDLKPQNIMLTQPKDGDSDESIRVKLVDFGLSRVNESLLGRSSDSSSNTRLGTILGTPGYMAPEQARGEPATSAADIFGLGSVLFEIYNGRPAFPGKTPADRLAQTLTGTVTPERPGCEESRKLCQLLLECLEKDAEKRPSANELYQRLGEQLEQRGESGGDSSGLLRRHAMLGLVGGLAGGLFGVMDEQPIELDLSDIKEIAVLTFQEIGDGSQRDSSGMPFGGRAMSEGEAISAAIVNELTGVDGLMVRRFRPLAAETPEQFSRLNEQLHVDAFLTGSYFSAEKGNTSTWVLRWRLIDPINGQVIREDEFTSEQPLYTLGDRMLIQKAVAGSVASRLGLALASTGPEMKKPLHPTVYGCLVKGKAQADTDSKEGLEQALECFNDAHQADMQWIEPIAAIALTSLNLAARTGEDEAERYLATATEKIREAQRIDPNSPELRLAKAMLEWQRFNHYDIALEIFDGLHRDFAYNWEVEHQRGLFLATLGDSDEALKALNRASRLNPMSVLLKTDRSRVEWFFGKPERAIRDAKRYRDEIPDGAPSRLLPVGLLVDVLEHTGDYEEAARAMGSTETDLSQEAYYQLRLKTIESIPYGPFGTELNQAIMNLRFGKLSDFERATSDLGESSTPMFPLLLTRHPAYEPLRQTDSSSRYAPMLTVS